MVVMALLERHISTEKDSLLVHGQPELYEPERAEFIELPEYPEMVVQDGHVKAFVSFFDASLFEHASPYERKMLRSAIQTMRVCRYPVGIIANHDQIDAVKTQGSGATFNGFVLYDNARRLYVPESQKKPNLNEAFDENLVFPVFQRDTTNMFNQPGLQFLNNSINDVTDWHIDGIIPIVVSQDGVNEEVRDTVYELGGLDQHYHPDFLAEIGEFVTNLPNAHPAIR